MSLGTPSRERKKTSSVPAPSKKSTLSSSSKDGSKGDKTTKSSKPETREKKSTKVKEENPSKSTTKSLKPGKDLKHSSKQKREKTVKEVVRPPSPEKEVEEDVYEDDFEDYSDDFESDRSEENSPMPVQDKTPEEEQQEIEEEGTRREKIPSPPPQIDDDEVEDLPIVPEDTPMLRRLATAQGRRELASAPFQPVSTQRRESRVLSASERKIDFSSAQGYDLDALNNNERRYRKLRELITFDSVKFVILDNPPVKDYDFYMQLFGDRGKMQTAAQTRDDDISQSVQTEHPAQRTIWTQAPGAMGDEWGGEETAKLKEDDGMSIFRENHLENENLKNFVEASAQVMFDLLASHQKDGKLLDLAERSDLAFSTGAHTIKLQPLAQKYKCAALTRNERESQTITAAFLVEESAARDIEGRSLIVETVVDCSRPPERLFICDGEISCMTYSPDGSALFAGTVDGSVVAFDLLDSELSFDSHIPWIDSHSNIILRRPAFDTSFFVAALSADEAAPVVYIHATNSQISVLNSTATLCIYGTQRDDSPRAGKTAGSRLTLALTALVKPDSAVLKSSSLPTPLIATCMAIPEEGQYVVGTDAGFLCSMSRSKNTTSHIGPRLFRGKMQSFGEITTLRVNPSDNKMLVAGLSTGSLQLIRLDQAAPIFVLTPPASIRLPVTSVEWSPTSSTGFYSWHGSSKILFWDISVGRAPITTSDLPSPIQPGVSLCWLEDSDQRIGFMAQGLADGFVEVHALEPPRGNKMRLGSAVRNLEST